MVAAFEQLCSEGVSFPFTSIEPTDLYVKVLTKTDAEQDLLESDSSLIWFAYPLNYEIAIPGWYYDDPSITDDSCSWQYGVVPIDYTLPSALTVETIYSVFIPDAATDYDQYEELYDLIEDRSLLLCGDTATDDEQTKSTKWNPSAKISLWDEVKDSNVPLDGICVKVSKGCKTASAIANLSGECTFSTKFKKKVNYSIEWERHYWKIVSGKSRKSDQMTGPTKTGRWECVITSSDGSNYLRAVIHMAALVANYKTIWPVYRPYKKNRLGMHQKVKIRFNNTNNGYVRGMSQVGSDTDLGADIVIWGKNTNGGYWDALSVFGSTLHELAHCSHAYYYDKLHSRGDFDEVNHFVSESWVRCVEWKVTSDYYNGLLGNRGYRDGFQTWTTDSLRTINDVYTPVFIDLIDNFNQSGFYDNAPYDVITGYTLKEIQDSILGSVRNCATLKSALLAHKMHNATESQIISLIHAYDTVSRF